MEGFKMEETQKESIEGLMYHMLQSNYKELCDRLKVELLDILIKHCHLNKMDGWTVKDLESLREGINKLRVKDKELETTAIVEVIDNLIKRGMPNGSSN
jgi:hypothetical protein